MMKTEKTIQTLLNENCVLDMQAVYDRFGVRIRAVDLHPRELTGRAPSGLLSMLTARGECLHELDRWQIEQAVHTILPRLPADIQVGIKVSRFGLAHGGCLQAIDELLGRDSPVRQRLMLEVPETWMAEDEVPLLRQVSALQRANIEVALGELGSGTAGFRHLTRPVFNEIRLGGALTRALPACTGVRGQTVMAWVGEARKLGARVSATGIKSQLELDAARWVGCSRTQGPLFKAPLPARGSASRDWQWCATEAVATGRVPRDRVSHWIPPSGRARQVLFW